MEIESFMKLDCIPAAAVYNRSHTNTTGRAFSCFYSLPKEYPTKKKVSDEAKTAMGTVVGLSALFTIFCLWKRGKFTKEKAERAKDGPTEVELESRHRNGDGDHPPDYNSVARTEVESVHREATAVQAVE